MKKTHNQVTAEDMRARAEELGCERAEDQRYERETKWEATVRRRWPKAGDSYVYKGIFEEVRDYLISRQRDLLNDYCSAIQFFSLKSLADVLSFCFNYEINDYEWNGKSFDIGDEDGTFNVIACGEESILDHELKDEIVDAFLDYLRIGAAKAMMIGSDTYVIWRKAYVDSVFRYFRFRDGADRKNVDELLKNVTTAAQLTWADIQIAAKLSEVSIGACEKKPKRAKKRR